MNLQTLLQRRFVDRLVSTPEGRAHVLAVCADGESNGEGQVFDRALAKADDPEVAQLIKRHAADEVRHAVLFQEQVDRQGVGQPHVPDSVKVVDNLDRALGGLMDRPIESRTDIMHMYLVLQVIEERAITQFAVMERAFRAVDPIAADVFVEIAKDEERHLKYCHAIAKKFRPDEATHAEALARYRRVEGEVYARVTAANTRWNLDRGYVKFSPVETMLWRGLASVTGRRARPMPTPYWGASATA